MKQCGDCVYFDARQPGTECRHFRGYAGPHKFVCTKWSSKELTVDLTVRCNHCAYLRRRTSHYYDDLICLMDEKPSEHRKECDFYSPKEVKQMVKCNDCRHLHIGYPRRPDLEPFCGGRVDVDEVDPDEERECEIYCPREISK